MLARLKFSSLKWISATTVLRRANFLGTYRATNFFVAQKFMRANIVSSRNTCRPELRDEELLVPQMSTRCIA